MNLDINTPRGQQSLSQERKLIKALAAVYPDISFVETHKALPAQIDGLMVKGETLVGIYENKCRNMSSDDMHKFNDEWLVTYEKIMHGAELSKRLRVPFYGFLYLVKNSTGVAVQITDDEGNIRPKIRIERTETQRTINGGSIVRTNAYIDITDSDTFII